MTLGKYRVRVFSISLLGLVVPFFAARPVFVIIFSQSFKAFNLPVTVACIFYLSNRNDLIGQHRNSMSVNGILLAILLFSIFASFVGITAVWRLISA